MTTFDLVIVAGVLLFALLGAFAGAARQVAQVTSVALGYAAASPLGALAGPALAKQTQVPLTVGIVLASAFSFFVVFLCARAALTAVLLRVLAGKEAKNRTLDRTLGFLIGGAKVLALAWIAVSALAWAEDRIVIAGKKLQLAPKESVALALARSYNAFELMQFQGLGALQAIASADPRALARLKGDEGMKSLLKDPRLQRLLSNEAFRKQLKAKDSRGLLGHDDVTSLLQDDLMRGRLERLAQQLAP